MIRYLGARVLSLLSVLLIGSLVVFSLLYIVPGDPATLIIGEQATPEQVARLHEQLGLDKPFPERYGLWIANALRGDLGYSFYQSSPVASIIGQRIAPSLSLAVLSQVIAAILGVGFGIYAARRQGETGDMAVMGFSLVGMAIPSFVLGLILIIVFGLQLEWLPVGGYVPPQEGLGKWIWFLALPATSLGIVYSAAIMRMTRTSIISVMSKDFTRTARAKGVSEGRIVYAHVLRNAAMPIVTIVGTTFGVLVTGALVTETIFDIPGLGQLMANSISRRDYPVIQGTVLLVTLAIVLVNFTIDLACGVIDPRTRR